MLPSVVPKLAQCKSTFDMHSFRLHHNCKIDTARFEQGKRPPTSSRLAPQTKLTRDAWTHAACWIKRERSSHVVGGRIRRWKPSHSLARLTAWWISQSQQQGARSLSDGIGLFQSRWSWSSSPIRATNECLLTLSRMYRLLSPPIREVTICAS